jgi:hypothetical protein
MRGWNVETVGFCGGSGGQALRLALTKWRYRKVVLVGMPLDGRYRRFLGAFRATAKKFDGENRIRSVSGNTARAFGRPTRQWCLDERLGLRIPTLRATRTAP